MSRWVFDIETDGYYWQSTKMHILAAYNIDTKEMFYWLENDLGWQEVFNEAKLVVGHNIIGFDIPVLKKLFGYELPKTCKIHDTVILSRILDYRRHGEQGHSLEVWGDALNYPKIEFDDFSVCTQEMIDYCLQDVRLNKVVYDELLDELRELAENAPQIRQYIRAEHAVATWCTVGQVHGWPFDMERALSLFDILEREMNETVAELEPKLGMKAKMKDKEPGLPEAVVKVPKWTKAGCYNAHTADWFGVHPYSGFDGEERPIAGPYCRVEFHDLRLSSTDDVKIFLYRNGWEPTTWNTKWDPELKRKVQTSPKITEDSLEFLGGDGRLYKEYLTASSRFGVLKGWIEATDDQGLLHGDCITIGTPSMRARHQTIVNVPSADSKWGREMRELFGTLPGWTLLGCDSASNQARGLAHYLEDAEYIDTLLNGDIHAYNAKLIDQALSNMNEDWDDYIIKADKAKLKKPVERFLKRKGISKETYLRSGRKSAVKSLKAVKRAAAKRILYAFLFGAGGDKLWSYIFGVLDGKKGTKFKNLFIKAVPGFKVLVDKLAAIYASTGKYNPQGYIPSLAGNRIYVDSYHKLLVYLLQSCEKITCSAAVMLIMERLEEAGIPYIPCIMMHDEADFMVPDEYADRAMVIAVQAFRDGAKLFGVEIMDGGAKRGRNWYEIH
jgi:DNA polymerase-1